MKFLVILSTLSTFTWAMILPRQTFPTCSQSCIANANLGSCSPDDDTCLCNTPAFVQSTASCIASSCTGNDLQQADAAAQSLCLAVGVTLSDSSIPLSTSSSTASQGSASTNSASTSASTTASVPATSSASSNSNGAFSNEANTLATLAVFGLVAAVAL